MDKTDRERRYVIDSVLKATKKTSLEQSTNTVLKLF